MADLGKAKVVVKETLLGTDQRGHEQLSAQTKAAFTKNARKDEETGELYMTQEEFINAIAPEKEDYVSQAILSAALFCEPLTNESLRTIAQNQA